MKKHHEKESQTAETVEPPRQGDAPANNEESPSFALGETAPIQRCLLMIYSSDEIVSSLIGSTVIVKGTCAAGWFVIEPLGIVTGSAEKKVEKRPIVARIVRASIPLQEHH